MLLAFPLHVYFFKKKHWDFKKLCDVMQPRSLGTVFETGRPAPELDGCIKYRTLVFKFQTSNNFLINICPKYCRRMLKNYLLFIWNSHWTECTLWWLRLFCLCQSWRPCLEPMFLGSLLYFYCIWTVRTVVLFRVRWLVGARASSSPPRPALGRASPSLLLSFQIPGYDA